MKFQIIAVVVAAFTFGFVLGHHTGKLKITPPVPISAHPPEQRRPTTATDDVDPAVIEGFAAMQRGEYAKAASFLKDVAELKIFYAIALEGAGESLAAKKLLTTDTDIERVRAIGRQAFLEQSDIFIAGPAYQLYLRMRPQPENREMMENAIRLWKEEQKK